MNAIIALNYPGKKRRKCHDLIKPRAVYWYRAYSIIRIFMCTFVTVSAVLVTLVTTASLLCHAAKCMEELPPCMA